MLPMNEDRTYACKLDINPTLLSTKSDLAVLQLRREIDSDIDILLAISARRFLEWTDGAGGGTAGCSAEDFTTEALCCAQGFGPDILVLDVVPGTRGRDLRSLWSRISYMGIGDGSRGMGPCTLELRYLVDKPVPEQVVCRC